MTMMRVFLIAMFIAAPLAADEPTASPTSPAQEAATQQAGTQQAGTRQAGAQEAGAQEAGAQEAGALDPGFPTTDAGLYPPSTLVYAEAHEPARLIALIFDHPLREKIESLEPYQMAIASPGYKRFLLGRTMVEGQLQMSWRESLETLLANRVSFAVDRDTQGGAVIIHGKDADSMRLFRDKLLEFTKLGENADKIEAGEYRGIQAHRINNLWYAVADDRLLITNKPDLGKAILDRMLDAGESLADNSRFQTALRARDETLAGWAFIDLHALRDAGVATGLFENQINNPVVELLVGGIQSVLQETPYATASLTATTRQLGLRLGMPSQPDWIPEERDYYFGPSGQGRGPALPTVSDPLFTLSTYRNVSEMWLRAGDLFNADINDGFAKADANLTTLFAGRDFGEDILGSFRSEVGFIATRKDFDDVLPRPTIKLPAFALVFELKEPETMTRELRRIYQSLVGFLNVVGAMNGQKQLELDMERLGDHAELLTASYVPEDDDRDSVNAEIVYNFSPSVGFAGERFVVSSTKELARQLTLAEKPDPDTIDENTHAHLDAGVLRDVLADNRDQLVAQNMLEDGNSREEAEAIIDLVLQLVGYVQDASIRLATTNDQLEAAFNIRVQP